MIVVAIVAWVLALGGVGAWLTKLGPWYYALRQPDWKPSDLWFGPVWTTIFLLAGVAWWLAWGRATSPTDRALIVTVYLVNGVLNAGWSYLFFYRQRPDWGLIEVPFLWLSIAAMIVVVGRLSPLGGWLLAPYLVWVSFASVLNRAIVRLN